MNLWLSHPTGNQFVRALLSVCETQMVDYTFFTSLAFDAEAWWLRALPAPLRAEMRRRSFPVPPARIRTRPWREISRLIAARAFRSRPAWSRARLTDQVYRDLDAAVARALRKCGQTTRPQLVYAYEDGAADTFVCARSLSIKCAYELPIAYWETTQRLLQEEAERYPAWEPTLGATREPPAKTERKSHEAELADAIICPSRFVLESLPESIRTAKACFVVPFGSPAEPVERPQRSPDLPLRVLFTGSMSQRKGLADLFAAMRRLRRSDVELVVLGTPLMPMTFYRREFPSFRYEPPRPHAAVLELMRSCDVLVLPSIVEGRALVQQEALSCGLPLIITPHTGGEDLVGSRATGIMVPIRAPEKIAEAISWFADHRSELESGRPSAQRKAAEFPWASFGQQILEILGRALRENSPKNDT